MKNNLVWTKPFYGVQYFSRSRIFGSVCDYENYAECGIFSWDTFKWSFKKYFFKSEHGNLYLEKAKKFIEERMIIE
jgi:hypothetical protein